MKKRYALTAMMCASLYHAQAQSELYAGVNLFPDVVETPYIFTDLLRMQHPELVYQSAGGTPSHWITSYKQITRKGEGGRFDELGMFTWSELAGRYDTMHHYQYTYKLDGSGRVTERLQQITASVGSGTPNRYSQKLLYTYSGNNITEIKRQETTSGVFEDHSTLFLFYDGQNNRISDSMSFESDPSVRLVTHYTYNAQNQCISGLQLFAGDTFNYDLYAYDNGRLVRFERHARPASQDPVEKIYQAEYSYYPDGSVNAALISQRFDPSPIEPSALYTHHYNSEKKLTAVVDYNWNLTTWVPFDSLAVRIDPSGNADTSYGYTGIASGGWQASPSSRYIFPASAPTGLKQQVAGEIALSLYPNPAADAVYIDLVTPAASPVSITVTDPAGKIIDRLRIQASQSTLEVPAGSWEPGVYFVQVETGSGKATRKVLISR